MPREGDDPDRTPRSRTQDVEVYDVEAWMWGARAPERLVKISAGIPVAT
jgi:hypothetical protein